MDVSHPAHGHQTFTLTNCGCLSDPNHGLMHPRRRLKLDSPTRKRIAAHLSTNYDVSYRSAAQHLPENIIEWGKLRLEELGEVTVHAQDIGVHRDSHRRDATFVKVS